MKIDLSKISTQDLLSELKNREGSNITSAVAWSNEPTNLVTVVD